MKKRFGLKPGDLLLMGVLVLLALFLFLLPFLRGSGAYAQILLAETGEKRTVSLRQDGSYEISARGVQLTVQVADGAIFVARSSCRDGICRSTPAISRGGQSIVCAPAGVVVRISGEEAVVDGVSG